MHKSLRAAAWTITIAAAILLTGGNHALSADSAEVSLSTDPAGKLSLVEDGKNPVPIVVFENAPPYTRRAADELAYYMEKISGAKPDVIEGEPDPIPDHAIWVGYQPKLKELFPELDFAFEHAEEILISANENHLVIAGRDVWDPEHLVVGKLDGVQQEYGTHNAIYTFLYRYLDVRWLWPGDLGEDIVEHETIAFEPFKYRYHPQVRARGGLLAYSQLYRGGPSGPEQPATYGGGARSNYWMRAQRLQLSSLRAPGGHGFGSWWKRLHETHPEYFALQPDGTRSLCTSPGNAKMCQSNPEVWEQWLSDVAAQLEENPNQRVFNASPGDSYHSGHCICRDCRAWDHLEANPRRLKWEGVSQKYVALSDRHITFANHIARRLKERFPGRELYLYMLAYGHSRPPPVEAVPDDNVIIGDVANFLLRSDLPDRNSLVGATHKEHFAGWGKLTDMHFWRPNTGSPVGWQNGLPDVPFQRTIEDMKFAAENGWVGIYVDYVREHWATQAPMYYLMAQLTWNPDRDGQAILDEFYKRAYGPAAAEMKDYWTYMEELRESCYALTEHGGVSMAVVCDYYNEERLRKAASLLNKAAQKAEAGAEKYRERVEFVQVGFDFTRLFTECGRLMQQIKKEGSEKDKNEAREKVLANWEQIRKLQQEHNGAMLWRRFFGGYRADGAPTMYYPAKQ